MNYFFSPARSFSLLLRYWTGGLKNFQDLFSQDRDQDQDQDITVQDQDQDQDQDLNIQDQDQDLWNRSRDRLETRPSLET